MCGQCGVLLGPTTDRNVAWQLFTKLLVLNERRGNQSTGVASVCPKGTTTLRGVMPSSKFVEDPQYHEMMNHGSSIWMGHCRLATSRPIDVANAHPVTSGAVVGTHNGYIWNDDELFAQFQLPRKLVVDSELLVAMEDAGKLVEGLKEVTGPVAAAFWNQRERVFKLVRVDNPLAYAWHDGAFFYSSELSHLKDIGLTPEEMPEETAWEFRGTECAARYKVETALFSFKSKPFVRGYGYGDEYSYSGDEWERWYPNRERFESRPKETPSADKGKTPEEPPSPKDHRKGNRSTIVSLFVYDDLRTDGLFNDDLREFYCFGRAEVSGDLYSVDGDPVLHLEGRGWVEGEVYYVPVDFLRELESVYRELDLRRVKVRSNGTTAWTFGCDKKPDGIPVPDGDWLAWMNPGVMED